MLSSMIRPALLLALFAVVVVGLVAASYELSKERIAANEKAAMLRKLNAVVKPDEYDNEIFTDVMELVEPEVLGSDGPQPVYRARRDGKPVAVVISTVAPDGYSGDIHMLVGIYHDGSVAGVRVVKHLETPGLGDGIEADRSDWILDFNSRSLADPTPENWKVKKDGGVFDQFTGATITPRAVVGAVRRALVYYAEHRDELYAVAEEAGEEK